MMSHTQLLLGALALLCLAYAGAQSLPEDPACGTEKGCFLECTTKSDCEFLVSWEQDGDMVTYTLSAVMGGDKKWMALGFSTDKEMGDDSVMGCKRLSGSTVKFTVRTTGQSPPTPYDDDTVELKDSKYENDVLTCTFERPVNAAVRDSVNTDEPRHYLFARGPLDGGGNNEIRYHGPSDRYFSEQEFRTSQKDVGGSSDEKEHLIKAHGSLMVIAWIFLASVAIVAARYCKPLWTVLLFSEKAWFQIHRTCMILVFCLTAIGFIIIFAHVEEWSDLENESEEYLEGHPIMGVIVMILTILNPIMAFIRPHPNTPMRPIFNWAHWFVGTAAHILGVITIFFGVQLNKADAPDYLIYILAGYVAWQVAVELSLEIITYCGKKSDRKELYDMDGSGTPTQNGSYEPEGILTLKRLIFVTHFFVVAAIAAVLVALIAVGKKELDD